ncbi:MAG TPA: Na+/H+ antiporter NhaA [Acidimicrobiia bacterium]|nr:Na+/H+ antiporter NhaA [Acidimicrobiia bacterium]
MLAARPDPTDSRALRLLHPLRDFLRTEAAGGIVLVVATVAALVWANAAPASYHDLWSTVFTIGTTEHHFSLTLREWVNDALMAIFFFVVGLEIKRELAEGELHDPRKAALPAIAAFGGMVVPALVYLAFNAGGAGADGWGIPMATDIAMAIGVLSLLGSRVPSPLKLFLLALAIVDDIGAILVIAVFYSHGFDGMAAVAAVGFLLAMIGLRLVGVRSLLPYVVLGAGVWIAVQDSGVHATIAGVVLGLLAPTRPFRQPDMVDADKLADVSTVETAHETVVLARESVSVVEWLEHLLHPWTSYVIVPVFALANAGVVLSSDSIDAAVSSPITHGIVVGLVVGKLVGISAFAWLATRLRVASLPSGTTFAQIVGIAALGGIGFTVSLFVSELAFGAAGAFTDDAKIGILAASLAAAALGAIVVTATTRAERATGPAEAGPELDSIVT